MKVEGREKGKGGREGGRGGEITKCSKQREGERQTEGAELDRERGGGNTKIKHCSEIQNSVDSYFPPINNARNDPSVIMIIPGCSTNHPAKTTLNVFGRKLA